jgi:hypothetical protein
MIRFVTEFPAGPVNRDASVGAGQDGGAHLRPGQGVPLPGGRGSSDPHHTAGALGA